MFWFLILAPTFGSSLWKKWRRSWLSHQRAKHLRSQTRLCRQTRHVALGCSQIYTQKAWEIHRAFFPLCVGVHVSYMAINVSLLCPCVCVLETGLWFWCCGDVWRCVRFSPLCPGIPLSGVMNIYQLGSWSLSVAGNLQLGTCLILTPFCLSCSQVPAENKLWERMWGEEGRRDTTTEGMRIGLRDGRLNNFCFYMLQL